MSNCSEIQHKPPLLLGSLCYSLYGSPENSPYILNRRSGCAPIIMHGYVQFFGGEIFRTRPDWPWGPPSLLYSGYPVIPGSKAAGAWRWTPTPSSSEIKGRLELYFYPPFGPSWPVLGELYLYVQLSLSEQTSYFCSYLLGLEFESSLWHCLP
jgi:hypothetical protein